MSLLRRIKIFFNKDPEYKEKTEHYPPDLAKYIRKHCALHKTQYNHTYDFYDMVDKCNAKIERKNRLRKIFGLKKEDYVSSWCEGDRMGW